MIHSAALFFPVHQFKFVYNFIKSNEGEWFHMNEIIKNVMTTNHPVRPVYIQHFT